MHNPISSSKYSKFSDRWQTAVLLTGLIGATAFAEGTGGDPNQNDRNQNYGNAANSANNGNQNYLQPDMMSHLMQAAQHMQQAQQAQQQQNIPQANQEQQLAQIEAAKAQQLQQQMQANNKSAQDNQNGADKTNDTDATGNQIGQAKTNPDAGRPVRENADYSRASTTVADTLDRSSDTPAPDSSLPVDQLANLSAAQTAVTPRASDSSARLGPVAAPDPGSAAPPDYSLVMSSTPKNEDTGAIGATTAGGSASAAVATGSDSSSSSPDAMGGVSTRLVAAAAPTDKADKDGDFWKQARNSVSDEDAGAGPDGQAPSLRGLRGKPAEDDTPGRKLSDQAFWKKLGSEPKECRLSANTGAAERAHTRCLKEARKKIEKQWRQRNSRQVASNAKSLRKQTPPPDSTTP